MTATFKKAAVMPPPWGGKASIGGLHIWRALARPFFLFVLLFLAACKPQQQAQLPDYNSPPGPPAKGDTLVTSVSGDPANLVPLLAGEIIGAEIAGNIYQSLVKYDANLNLVPQLAEKWEFTDGGPGKGVALTFHLKPNLKFADGTPLTSADCLASLHAITDPNTRTPHAGDYLLVTKAEAPDPLTFTVHYDEPLVTTLATWAGFAVMPKHVIDENKDFNETSLRSKPLGSGSYTLADWKHGQYLYLTANNASTEAPYIQHIFYRILPDDSAEWLELKAGNLDMAGLTPLAFSRLTDAPWFTQRYQKIHYLSNAYTFVGFNLKNPKFQNKLVRQGLSYAVDRQGMINAVFFGQAQPMAGVFKPGTWAYDPNLKPYPYDPAKAIELLKQAGYTRGLNDGLMRNAKGEQLSFTLTTNQNNAQRLKAAQVLQKCLADIGVTVQIRAQEWSTFVTNTIRNRDFEAVMLGWSLSAEPDPYDIWHSSKTKPAEFNIIGYNNPQADALMVAARKEFDQTKRQQLLWQFQAILADEQPYLFLYAPDDLMAISKRIVGIKPAPAGISYNGEQWYVPQNWQLRNSLAP